MNFASFQFVGFFAIVVCARNCLRSFAAEKWLLVAASICFYLTWSVPCVFVILFTALSDFLVTQKMAQASDPVIRKRLLITSLLVNLGILGFFKYTNFFLENLRAIFGFFGWHAAPFRLDVVLPPGISFFTFASMSYVIDVYYERISACKSALDYTLFLTFFPKLLSGPIVRASEMLPQLKDRLRASANDFEVGLAYIVVGAVKKLVIADQIAGHVNLIFSSPGQYDSRTLLMGCLGYTVQIYCDFSGYSDMAIGCARILGFRFPENFQLPYSAVTITEFWRRWHITLSRWFRDYLFLPLEMATRGNPSPTLRVSINMTLTMLLCGLWHGPSWNFVIWGGVHGAALAAHKAWTAWNPLSGIRNRPVPQFLWVQLSRLLTLSVVALSMIFFRTESFSDAISYFSRLLSWTQTGQRLGSPYISAAVAIVFLVHLVMQKDRNFPLELPQWAFAPRVLGYASLVALLALFGATDAAPFIYFQF